jgi:hypothetical protein
MEMYAPLNKPLTGPHPTKSLRNFARSSDDMSGRDLSGSVIGGDLGTGVAEPERMFGGRDIP